MRRIAFLWLTLLCSTPSITAEDACCECHHAQADCNPGEKVNASKDCVLIDGVYRNQFEVQCERELKFRLAEKQCAALDDHDKTLVRLTKSSAPEDKRTTRGCGICRIFMKRHGNPNQCLATDGNLVDELALYLKDHPHCRNLYVDNIGCFVLQHYELVEEEIRKKIVPMLAGGRKFTFVANQAVTVVNNLVAERPGLLRLEVFDSGVIKREPGPCQDGAECDGWVDAEERPYLCALPDKTTTEIMCCPEQEKSGLVYRFRKKCSGAPAGNRAKGLHKTGAPEHAP